VHKMASSKPRKVVNKSSQGDVEVELPDVYAANEGTSQDDVLVKINPEDQEIIDRFYVFFDYVMVFPQMGEGQTPFDPKDPSSSEQSAMAKYVINRYVYMFVYLYVCICVLIFIFSWVCVSRTSGVAVCSVNVRTGKNVGGHVLTRFFPNHLCNTCTLGACTCTAYKQPMHIHMRIPTHA